MFGGRSFLTVRFEQILHPKMDISKKKKNMSRPGFEPGSLDSEADALPTRPWWLHIEIEELSYVMDLEHHGY